jgi:anti-sigma B factor antagonist
MSTLIRMSGATTIVDVTGYIDLSSSPAFRKMLLETLNTAERLAINLVAVKYIDSSAIASLLEVLQAAREKRKGLVLFGIAGAVREVLQLTRLTGVFEIYESEEAALNAAAGRGSTRP